MSGLSVRIVFGCVDSFSDSYNTEVSVGVKERRAHYAVKHGNSSNPETREPITHDLIPRSIPPPEGSASPVDTSLVYEILDNHIIWSTLIQDRKAREGLLHLWRSVTTSTDKIASWWEVEMEVAAGA